MYLLAIIIIIERKRFVSQEGKDNPISVVYLQDLNPHEEITLSRSVIIFSSYSRKKMEQKKKVQINKDKINTV